MQFNTDDKTHLEREQYLLRLFDIHSRRTLFLLNDLLDVCFRRNLIESETNVVQTYEYHLNELILHILNKLIDSSNSNGTVSSESTSNCFSPSKIIFIIDDIHFADEISLRHLLKLGSHSKSLLILSMKPPTNNTNDRPHSNTLQSIRTDSRVYRRILPRLELEFLATLGKKNNETSVKLER